MKRAFPVILFLLALLRLPGWAQTAGFIEAECGMIVNPDYYFENYLIGSHGAGYRLYHNDVVIVDEYEQMGGPHGQELRFWDDTVGLFIVSYGFSSSTKLYKITNNEVTLLGSSPGFIYDLFVASRHTFYFATLGEPAIFAFVTRMSDMLPNKRLAFPLTSDTTVTDTVMGLTFCPDLDRLDYIAQIPGDTHNCAVLLHVDTLVSITQPEMPGLAIFPNPASVTITIETPATGHLYILNLNGQPFIARQVQEARTIVDISTLQSGVYVVKVVGEKGVQVGKFIRQ